jgi:chemosensory pili system protein ChpA (sensor histidine kinase/response regulator)
METTVEALDLAYAPLSAALEPCLQEFEQLRACFDALADLSAHAEPEAQAPALYAAGRLSPPAAVPGASGAPAMSAAIASPPRSSPKQLVRVRAQTLDRLIDQAGEVMISRARADGHVTQMRIALGDLGRSLDRLRQQLRDMELQAELQMQSGLTQPQDARATFDPLELDRFTRVQEVSRMMAESVSDVETMHRSLQSSVDGALENLLIQGRRAKQLTHDLLRMRLLEFEALSDRLYAVVRQASKGAGKQVRLDIVGGSIEIDRGVLERMTPAFEHLLRNAVAHGIEPAPVRLAAGKPAVGALSIGVQQDGSDVSVTFADDGAGLQIDKIQARAQASGLLAPDQVLSHDEAAQLLFVPGFSTADEVTELAGRGIGLDVVLSEVSAIGGRIETHSQPGLGTSFKVVFPLTTAVTQVVLLRMGTLTIGVPANLLETVLRVPRATLDQAYASASLADGDRPAVPFFWGGALLKASTRSYGHKTTMRQYAVAVIRSAGQRVALHVDEVLGSREVVVKNLGPQLSRLPGLAGMSVLASGAVVLIYNPVALASLFGDAARRVQAMALDADGLGGLDGPGVYGAPAALAPLVLVVDDSITVRRVTQRLLQREGYRVALAGDGQQALELLQDERPAVVLSDIEMPRMDGMELTRQIRQDPAFADLPIIVITSRIAQKHRDHAAALGVNHYLGKPYAESELLGLVRTHCTAAVPA